MSNVLYIEVYNSTVQYSTVQYSTVLCEYCITIQVIILLVLGMGPIFVHCLCLSPKYWNVRGFITICCRLFQQCCGLPLITALGYSWLHLWISAALNCLQLWAEAEYSSGLQLLITVDYSWLQLWVTASLLHSHCN